MRFSAHVVTLPFAVYRYDLFSSNGYLSRSAFFLDF